MAVILHDVPAHIQYMDTVHSAVLVKGGTNWDLSREALESPVHFVEVKPPYSPPVPVSSSPSSPLAWGAPAGYTKAETIYFRPNSTYLSKSDFVKLRNLKRGEHAVVSGHSSKGEKNPEGIASRRALEVSRVLNRQGVLVDSVRTLSDSVPAEGAGSDSALDRRVEVFEKR